MASGANYEAELRRRSTDGVKDQDECIALLGDKTNYRGANYYTGQPFIEEGDPKANNELHKAVTNAKLSQNSLNDAKPSYRKEI